MAILGQDSNSNGGNSETLQSARVALISFFGSFFDQLMVEHPSCDALWAVDTARYDAECRSLRAEVNRLNTILAIREDPDFRETCLKNINEVLLNSHCDTMLTLLLLEIFRMLQTITHKLDVTEYPCRISNLLGALATQTDFSHLPSTYAQTIIESVFPPLSPPSLPQPSLVRKQSSNGMKKTNSHHSLPSSYNGASYSSSSLSSSSSFSHPALTQPLPSTSMSGPESVSRTLTSHAYSDMYSGAHTNTTISRHTSAQSTLALTTRHANGRAVDEVTSVRESGGIGIGMGADGGAYREKAGEYDLNGLRARTRTMPPLWGQADEEDDEEEEEKKREMEREEEVGRTRRGREEERRKMNRNNGKCEKAVSDLVTAAIAQSYGAQWQEEREKQKQKDERKRKYDEMVTSVSRQRRKDEESVNQLSVSGLLSLPEQVLPDTEESSEEMDILSCPHCHHRMEVRAKLVEDHANVRGSSRTHRNKAYQDLLASRAKHAQTFTASLGVTFDLLSQHVFSEDYTKPGLAYDTAVAILKEEYKELQNDLQKCAPAGWDDSIVYSNQLISLLPPRLLAIMAASGVDCVPTSAPTLGLPRLTSVNPNITLIAQPHLVETAEDYSLSTQIEMMNSCSSSSTSSSSSSSSSDKSKKHDEKLHKKDDKIPLKKEEKITHEFEYYRRPGPFSAVPRISLFPKPDPADKSNPVAKGNYLSYPLTTAHLFEIKKIDNKQHPCHGQYGLFARITIGGDNPDGPEYYKATHADTIPDRLGVHLADYTGVITYEYKHQRTRLADHLVAPVFHRKKAKRMYVMTYLEVKDCTKPFSTDEDDESPVDEIAWKRKLHQEKDVEIIIDAAEIGNETRYINHYKNISPTPNVQFMFYRCPYTHELRMGIFLLRRILAGEEVVVDYGKNFSWKRT